MTKILIDCDPGHDDAVAILYAARHLDLVAITTVFGNASVENTTRNALAICALGGLEVPVARGFSGPFVGGEPPFAAAAHGRTGIDGAELPAPRREPAGVHAVEMIIETARRHQGELVLAIIGAHTNVAVALRLEPRLRQWLRAITVMGGTAGVGNVVPTACINVYSDPEAAHVVFTSGVPITWIGYELTRTVLMRTSDIARLRAGGTVARTIGDLAEFYRQSYIRIYGIDGAPMHDGCAILPFVRGDLIRHEPAALAVELAPGLARGMTLVDRRGIRPGVELPPPRTPRPPNLLMAVEADVPRVIDAFVDTLLTYP
ncbi:MAG: nucleoside hydrolase [Alphaproteobacteria bacterium]|nr:nucleoside hydrolase [Alphaproteobacteria bacterium]